MQQRARVALSCLLGVFGSAVSATAAEPEDAIVYPVGAHELSANLGLGRPPLGRRRFDDDPYYLELRAGVATTVGVLGLVAEYDVSDRWALGAGLGTNLYGSDFEVNARYRPIVVASSDGRALHALTLEGALTNAAYAGSFPELVNCTDGCDHTIIVQRVFWAQLELGWEMRLGSGMTVRTAIGGATLLGNYDWHCTGGGSPCDESNPPARTLPSATAGWGIAF